MNTKTNSINERKENNVEVKFIAEEMYTPKYSHPEDACMDLKCDWIDYAFMDDIITCHTGLKVEIPEGYVGLVFPRSSICKHNLMMINSVGVIDSNYRGEITLKFTHVRKPSLLKRILYWIEQKMPEKDYHPEDRIGQLMVIPYPKISLVKVEELSETDRGEGGYGSTGDR